MLRGLSVSRHAGRPNHPAPKIRRSRRAARSALCCEPQRAGHDIPGLLLVGPTQTEQACENCTHRNTRAERVTKRRSSRRLALALVAVLSTTACGDGGSPTRPSQPISDLARAYLEQLIDFMQPNSINRLTIDWTAFRSRVFDAASSAQTISDTYPAIRVALELLADHGHSQYRAANGTVIAVPGRSCFVSTFPSIPTLPSTVGYVKVHAFSGVGAAATGYANEVQGAIVSADRDDLIGWIVDLRGNGGGNMWPMVAAVGPVLGEGVVGYFFDPTGVENVWEVPRRGLVARWRRGATCRRAVPATTRAAESGRAHGQRRRQLRRSDGHCFHWTPKYPIVRRRDLRSLHREQGFRHE